MSKHKLLLADDSVTIQKVVNLTFADEGIEVTAVGDGDSAMLKFVESVPDLVMVDVNMPGLDGYRICEMIKQDEETRHIPVILLVGSFEPFDEEEARRVGADDFLTKPFQSIRQLVNKVSALLHGKTSDTFGDETAISSFDDTLEMIPPVEEMSATEDFGDAAMDDEMIQTSQIGSLPTDEQHKFESAPIPQTSDENSNSETEAADEDFLETSAQEISAEETPTEAEFVSEENADEIEDVSADDDELLELLPRHENIYEFANEQESADEKPLPEESETEETEQDFTEEIETDEAAPDFEQENVTQKSIVEETAPNQVGKNRLSSASAPIHDLEFDDFDLLELPPSKKFEDEQTKVSFGQSSVADAAPSSGNLSPEAIEAIADRVVEKLSDKVIKRIVREVFTQMTKKK
ncbi:MAG: response regulator [Pyrinomonadaceae bacterium]|nr:response regulator [Pyrinomonadaceae bacterium]